MEKWKEIPGYESRYLISNTGAVKSLVYFHNGKTVTNKERILRQVNNRGYLRVALTDFTGIVKHHCVHRLVLSAFKGSSTLSVNHIDGNKQNNNLSNLEWVTHSENQKHAYRIGLEKPVNNGLSKGISIYKNGVKVGNEISIREACRKYNLDRRSVNRVIAGKYKHHHGYTFKIL